MGAKPRRPINMPTRRAIRRTTSSSKRTTSSSSVSNTSVSDKLEALKNLIPANDIETAGDIRADKIFQETADYILLLRTQVSVLQKLVDFYDRSQNNVVQQ